MSMWTILPQLKTHRPNAHKMARMIPSNSKNPIAVPPELKLSLLIYNELRRIVKIEKDFNNR